MKKALKSLLKVNNFECYCIESENSRSSFVILETVPFNNGYGYCISGFSSTGVSTQNNKMPFYFVGAPGSLKYRGKWIFVQSFTNLTKSF